MHLSPAVLLVVIIFAVTHGKSLPVPNDENDLSPEELLREALNFFGQSGLELKQASPESNENEFNLKQTRNNWETPIRFGKKSDDDQSLNENQRNWRMPIRFGKKGSSGSSAAWAVPIRYGRSWAVPIRYG